MNLKLIVVHNSCSFPVHLACSSKVDGKTNAIKAVNGTREKSTTLAHNASDTAAASGGGLPGVPAEEGTVRHTSPPVTSHTVTMSLKSYVVHTYHPPCAHATQLGSRLTLLSRAASKVS